LGDLLVNLSNVDILYNKKIKLVGANNGNAEFVETFNNEKYFGNNIILSAGAIQTPAILQRSGIDCGNKLYDHAGFTILYKKVITTDTIIEEVDGYTSSELTTLGLNIYNINDGGTYDITSSSLNSNSAPKSMHAIFRHTKLSDSDVDKVKLGQAPVVSPTLSTTNGIYYVYDMGDFWNGGGHPGGSQWNNLTFFNYDLTSTLIGSHGLNSYWRLINNGAKLVGVKRTSTSTQQTTSYSNDLGFEANKIIGHLQTRDISYNWQTYYSTVSSLPDSLILTHAQSTNLSGKKMLFTFVDVILILLL